MGGVAPVPVVNLGNEFGTVEVDGGDDDGPALGRELSSARGPFGGALPDIY